MMMRQTSILAAVLLSLGLSALGQSAAVKTEPLKAGTLAPDFTLSDTNGKSVTLSKIKQPTILVFYRGYW